MPQSYFRVHKSDESEFYASINLDVTTDEKINTFKSMLSPLFDDCIVQLISKEEYELCAFDEDEVK